MPLYVPSSGGGGATTKADVGLGNVDNTADTAKPVSTATQAVFDQDLMRSNMLAVGEETLSRDLLVVASAALTTQVMRLCYFTARKSETTTQVRIYSGNTAAAATPTLVRIGLFTVAGNGDLTGVASTASDTALFAAANTAYTKSWSASYAKVAGQRYALGLLVVSGAATPSLYGNTAPPAGEMAVAPRLTGQVTGQTDLPSSVANGSIGNTGTRFYGVVLP